MIWQDSVYEIIIIRFCVCYEITGLCYDIKGLCNDMTGLCYYMSGFCYEMTWLCYDMTRLYNGMTGLCYGITGLCYGMTGLCCDMKGLCYDMKGLCYDMTGLCYIRQFSVYCVYYGMTGLLWEDKGYSLFWSVCVMLLIGEVQSISSLSSVIVAIVQLYNNILCEWRRDSSLCVRDLCLVSDCPLH